MKKGVFAFIVLVSLNIPGTAQISKTSLAKTDDKIKTNSGRNAALTMTSTGVAEKPKLDEQNTMAKRIELKAEDSFNVNDNNNTEQILNYKGKGPVKKKEIHDVRNWRFEKFMLNLAQIFDYL